ncbi:MAG: hypothetical protein ACRCSL_11710, partial [Microbacterium sp.]
MLTALVVVVRMLVVRGLVLAFLLMLAGWLRCVALAGREIGCLVPGVLGAVSRAGGAGACVEGREEA